MTHARLIFSRSLEFGFGVKNQTELIKNINNGNIVEMKNVLRVHRDFSYVTVAAHFCGNYNSHNEK